MAIGNKKTKEELLEIGFIEMGVINRAEYMAKVIDTGDKDAFAYHMLVDGKTVWDFPQTTNWREVSLLASIHQKLFKK